MSQLVARFLCWLLAIPMLVPSVWGAPSLRLSSAGTAGGNKVTLLLTLSEAGGVAGIRTQINFDPQLLSFGQATCGQLGSLFDLSTDVADGCLYLTFARTDQLTSGQGILANLDFIVNPGAKSGLHTDLAIAQVLALNQNGARLPVDARSLANSGASVSVTNNSFADFVDLDNDGLRDDWEDAHGLPADRPNALDDPDKDGRPNVVEFALGSNPLVADSTPPLLASREQIAGTDYLTLSYPRKKAASNCRFILEQSNDLVSWSFLPETTSVIEATDVREIEKVVFRENTPMQSLQARFFQLKIIVR